MQQAVPHIPEGDRNGWSGARSHELGKVLPPLQATSPPPSYLPLSSGNILCRPTKNVARPHFSTI